jgi:hypothetical protein
VLLKWLSEADLGSSYPANNCSRWTFLWRSVGSERFIDRQCGADGGDILICCSPHIVHIVLLPWQCRASARSRRLGSLVLKELFHGNSRRMLYLYGCWVSVSASAMLTIQRVAVLLSSSGFDSRYRGYPLWLRIFRVSPLTTDLPGWCPFFFFRIKWNSVLYYWGHYWPIVPAPDDDECRIFGGMLGKGSQITRRERTCPSAALSTINPTWSDLGSNPGRRGGKPANNRLSYFATWNSALDINSYRFLLYTFRDYCSRVFSPIDAP